MCVFIFANTCVLIATCVADVQPVCIVAGKSWDLKQMYIWNGLIHLLNLQVCSFKLVGVLFKTCGCALLNLWVCSLKLVGVLFY